jgi:predicted nucleic acid-binding protein
MRFWDSSAIVPLLVEETCSRPNANLPRMRPILTSPWWDTEVESASALAGVEREGQLTSSAVGEALRRLERFAAAWREVQPIAPVEVIAPGS